MKRTFISLFAVLMMLVAVQTYAQAPQSFNYQAVARNSAGDLLANQTLGIKVIIHQTSSSGTIVYSETFSPTTNQFGLLTIGIGTGTVVTGTFATISWATDNYYLQVQMDPAGGTAYTDMGTSQLLSVPYALYAANTGSSQTLAQTLAAGNSAGSYSIDMNGMSITNANVFGLGNSNANYINMYYGHIYDYDGSHGNEGEVLTVHGTSPNTYVTWDSKSATTYAFSAYASTSTTATGQITFDTESYDDASAFASSAFTAPAAGLYHFDAAARLNGVTTAGDYLWIAFYVNGSVTKDVTSQTSANTFGLNISTDLMLNAGDVVTVHDYCAQTLSTVTGVFNTWFNGHRIY